MDVKRSCREMKLKKRVSPLIRPLGHTDLSNGFLMQILLYGDKDFPDSRNKDILLLALRFINETVVLIRNLDFRYKPYNHQLPFK